MRTLTDQLFFEDIKYMEPTRWIQMEYELSVTTTIYKGEHKLCEENTM